MGRVGVLTGSLWSESASPLLWGHMPSLVPACETLSGVAGRAADRCVTAVPSDPPSHPRVAPEEPGWGATGEQL